MHLKTNVSRTREASHGGEVLDRNTASLVFIVFVINLFQGYKSLRQIQSASDWNKPEALLDVLRDNVKSAGKKILGAGSQLWGNPLKASWRGLLWALGDHLDDWWNICDVITVWMVNATLVLLIWRTEWTVEFAIITSFLNLLNLLGYLRGFEVSF